MKLEMDEDDGSEDYSEDDGSFDSSPPSDSEVTGSEDTDSEVDGCKEAVEAIASEVDGCKEAVEAIASDVDINGSNIEVEVDGSKEDTNPCDALMFFKDSKRLMGRYGKKWAEMDETSISPDLLKKLKETPEKSYPPNKEARESITRVAWYVLI